MFIEAAFISSPLQIPNEKQQHVRITFDTLGQHMYAHRYIETG